MVEGVLTMEKRVIRITESELKRLIGESVMRRLQTINEEDSFKNNQGYSHFAVNKATNKIVNGWDYKEYDPDELRQFKRDYFTVDLIDYGFDPKQYKILTARGCMRQGIDPDDNANWANE